jgi:coenzyme F420-reducing hydrogenase delta subunit
LYVLKTFESNADGVFVAGCLEGGCHYSTGNLYAKKRILRLKKMLDAVGVGGERLEFYNLSAAMAEKFVEVCEEMVARIKKLGPLPWRCTR